MESRRYFCLLAITVILAVVRVSPAQEDTWSSGGPYDASVMSIAIHPFDNQKIYIGTLESFIFQTTNGGSEWSVIEDTLNGWSASRSVMILKIHHFGPDTMFAATQSGAYKSTDAGQNWSQMFPQWPYNGWDALEVNREDPVVVFLGTWGSFWRSTDGGQTWQEMNGPQGAVRPIKADPVDPRIIYVGNNTSMPDASIWKSYDSGVTWENIHNNLQYDANDHALARALEVDPVDHEIVYLARECPPEIGEYLVKSTNGGRYWTDISPPGLYENMVYDVAVSPLDHNTVFACTNTNGILRSSDGGSSWEEINEGISGINRRMLSVVVDPSTGIVYLGRLHDGIYRSTNNGDSWEKISYNITGSQCFDIAANRRDPDTLFTATHNGLYMSTDGTASWGYIDLDFPDYYSRSDHVEVDPYDPSYVYVSYYGKSGPYDPYSGALYRSTDGGSHWESFTEGLLGGRSYREIAVADYGSGVRRLFMASGVGLFYSDDLGEAWSLCGSGLPPDIECADLDVSSVIPDLVFVGDYSCDLYKSTDGGRTWELLSNLPEGDNIQEIACDPVDPDIVYIIVGWDVGIFKSTDSGQTWNDINNNLPRGDYFIVSGIAINPQNPENLYVNSYNRGIFQSHDGGQSWEDFNENLQTTFGPACTLIDPVDTSRVFLATNGNSVWEITRTTQGGDCVYIPGDCNHNGTALELPDVMAMISIYRGTVEPYYTCDCPTHGDTFAPEVDPNGNCVTLELADVVMEIGAYRGTAEASGCPDCPGSLRLMPSADSPASSGIPSLSTKVKSKAGPITD